MFGFIMIREIPMFVKLVSVRNLASQLGQVRCCLSVASFHLLAALAPGPSLRQHLPLGTFSLGRTEGS